MLHPSFHGDHNFRDIVSKSIQPARDKVSSWDTTPLSSVLACLDLLDPVRERRGVEPFTLPDHRHVESQRAERLDLPRVAAAVGGKLFHPEIMVACGDRAAHAMLVVVPETTVDEDRPAPRLVGEVRRTRQAPHVASIEDAVGAERRGDEILYMRLVLAHAFHQGRAHGVGWELDRHCAASA